MTAPATYRYSLTCRCGAQITGSAPTRRELRGALTSSAGIVPDPTYPSMSRCVCGAYLVQRDARIWRGRTTPAIECDARCTWARGDDCTCACGGAHHGHDAALAAVRASTGYLFPSAP